jgi:hypothetical protein
MGENPANALHMPEHVDIYSNDTVYLKAVIDKSMFKNAKLILTIHDIPKAIPGYVLYWDESHSYFLFKFQNSAMIDSFLYYFELMKVGGGSSYLGSNGMTNSEWEVNHFEYQVVDNVLDNSGWIQNESFLPLSIEDDTERIRQAAHDFFAKRSISAEEFVKRIGRHVFHYPMHINFSALKLFSNEDKKNFYDITEKEVVRLKLALSFQFTYLGSPDSLLEEEEKKALSSSPSESKSTSSVKKQNIASEIENTYNLLAQIRKDNKILEQGDFRFIFAKDGVIGFERFLKDQKLAVFINNSDKSTHIDVTEIFGNGDFVDISKNHPLKRKKTYTLYENDFVILKKIKDR